MNNSKPKDECAIAGIYFKNKSLACIAREMLIELNHRGQESSGIAIANGKKIKIAKGKGLAETLFTNSNSLPAIAHPILAIGHNRYSTSGNLLDIQPFLYKNITLAHNGNLTNINQLKKQLKPDQLSEQPQSDSWYALKLIVQSKGKSLTEKVFAAVSQMEGAFSFVIASKDTLIAVRDPWGFRPLVLGRLGNGYVVASESAAIIAIGAKLMRSVLPGEILTIHKNKTTSTIYKQKIQTRCIFELIYIQRPDSVFDDIVTQQFRVRCGRILGRKAPVEADTVIAVPRSGISAAIGVSEELGIPYREGLYTNPYRGAIYGHRTFIRPHNRERAASEKYSIIQHIIREYPRIILVDDSIVRGVTMKELVKKLRRAGAYEIHLRIASPPLISACYMGVDFGTKELMASDITTIEKRRKFLGVDSLVHLIPAELIEAALGNPINENGRDVFTQYSFCGSCFTGKYPINIEGVISKNHKKIHA